MGQEPPRARSAASAARAQPAGRAPAPQAISALLRRAGFERSNHGRPGVGYDEVSTGFVVWETRHRNAPRQPLVAVQHNVSGMFSARTDEGWAAYLAEARARLEDYAGVIREAGYHVLVRDRGEEPPWLTVLTVVPCQPKEN